jgi:hypothetical protein
MFAANQDRPGAVQNKEFPNPLGPPDKAQELRNLQRTHAALAGGEDLRADGSEATASRRRKYRDKHDGAPEEEDKILKCLGAAVIMRWNTLPTKLQRELFEHADSVGDMFQAASLREPIARFLHDHKDDQKETQHRNERLRKQLVDSPGFKSRNATAKVRDAVTRNINTRVEVSRSQMLTAVVLDELWRFSCEMPDAPHLNRNLTAF